MLEDAIRLQVMKNLGSNEGSMLLEYIKKNKENIFYFTRIPLYNMHIRMDVLCIDNIQMKFPISILGDLDKLRKHLRTLQGHSGKIIEIKENLNFEALGQIIADIYYFPQEYPNIPITQYSILCRYDDDCIEKVCSRHGISVIKL